MPGNIRRQDCALCGFYSAGIICTLVAYGLLQERIMSEPYGSPPEYFDESVFLVFCNRVIAVIFSILMVLARGESFVSNAPPGQYMLISFTSVYASSCQYDSLMYVSFPLQMLGKSAKMLPVMCWGMCVSEKNYRWIDWLVAASVAGGIVIFLTTGPIAGNTEAMGHSSMYGIFLLLCFLVLDGFTSTYQEKLFKDYETSKYNQMLYINLFSCALAFFSLAAFGGLKSGLNFCKAHPAFVVDATRLSVAAVAGQWFIYSQVEEFGALVFAATVNIRQVASILLSYAAFNHSITLSQFFGLLVVFIALFAKTACELANREDRLASKLPLLKNKAPDAVTA